MVIFRRLAVGAALIGAPLLTVASISAAGASTQHHTPVPTVQGHVALAGPLQYAWFHASAHQTGSFSYTNFEARAASGVWNISGAKSLMFTLGGSSYTHTLQGVSIMPVSPIASAFKGTGFFNANPATKWTITGRVVGNDVAFHIHYYAGPDAGYFLYAVGHIGLNGSVFGFAQDRNGHTLRFAMPPGSAFTVLHYNAIVNCAVFHPLRGNARFGFTIPSYAPAGLAGMPIVVKVHDGGVPGPAVDTYAHGVATSRCQGPATAYQITSGNITVHH